MGGGLTCWNWRDYFLIEGNISSNSLESSKNLWREIEHMSNHRCVRKVQCCNWWLIKISFKILGNISDSCLISSAPLCYLIHSFIHSGYCHKSQSLDVLFIFLLSSTLCSDSTFSVIPSYKSEMHHRTFC